MVSQSSRFSRPFAARAARLSVLFGGERWTRSTFLGEQVD